MLGVGSEVMLNDSAASEILSDLFSYDHNLYARGPFKNAHWPLQKGENSL